MLRGADPATLDTQGRRTVLSPGEHGLGWIKDPVVVRVANRYRLYCAAPPRQGPSVEGRVVVAGPLDATVLAESDDGIYFPSIEYVFEAPGDDTWHGRRARLNSLLPWDDGWVATYDGGRTFYNNYEEWAGLTISKDGRGFTRIATDEPWVRSPFGSVRYLYGLEVNGQIYFYYEYTREDGSHDLRVSHVSAT